MKQQLALAAVVALLGSTSAGFVAAAEEAAIVRGGRLYDNWSNETKEKPPNEAHPALGAKRGDASAADSWRCRTAG